jgi:hypothetical protein
MLNILTEMSEFMVVYSRFVKMCAKIRKIDEEMLKAGECGGE